MIDLFDDRTKKNNSMFINGDDAFESLKFTHCQSLNDKSTIKFHQRFKQENDVFDESRGIWISEHIDPINDDLFIPRDDAQ